MRKEIRELFPLMTLADRETLYATDCALRGYAMAVRTRRAHLFGDDLERHERATNQLEATWMDCAALVRALLERIELTPEQAGFIDDILTPPDVWLE